MNADIFDVDKFVKVNNLEPVTDPIIFNRGNIPSPNGLLSTEIFGRTPDDRKTKWAYIDLGGRFIHPVVYKSLLRLDRRFEGIVAGVEYYNINVKGELEKSDEENGKTGLDFLYKNWDKIVWKDRESLNANERIKLNKNLTKNEVFLDKIPVCPAFYRDVNIAEADTGKVAVGVVNEMYSKIIRLSNAIKNDTTGLAMIGHSTRQLIEKEIIKVYDFFISDNIKGKNGLFRKFVLGVSVDYGTRLVMSCQRFVADTYDEMPVNFMYTGVPLAACCTQFFPFVLKYVKDLFYNEFYLKKKKATVNDKGEIEYVEIKNPENLISDDYITKSIDSFIHSPADRFKQIEVDTKDGKSLVIAVSGYYQDAKGGDFNSSTIINRPATWTDILYMACEDVVKDKHVVVTRYPVTSKFNIYANRIHVLSTHQTVPVIINGKSYKYYPSIDVHLNQQQVSTQFIDTLNPSNLYLGEMGGDFDGDQISARGVFSQEANAEIEKYMVSLGNLVNSAGQCIRYTERDALQAIYNFTKTHP